MAARKIRNEYKVSSSRVEIAVIGGGIIGLTTAWKLAIAGEAVAVFDAGDEIAGATTAAAGMLAPSFEMSSPSDGLLEFGIKSLKQWNELTPNLEKESEHEIDLRTHGALGVAIGDEDAARLHASCEAVHARGATVEWLTGDEARALEPALSKEITGGLHAPDDAQVDPIKAKAALRVALKRRDVTFHSGVVRAVAIDGEGFRVLLANGEEVTAAKLVLATGAAASGLVEGLPAQPVFPVKGEAVSLTMETPVFRRYIRGPGAYLCPKSDNRLVIGASEHRRNADLEPDPQEVATLKRNAARLISEIADWPELRRWAGLRPGTPDKAPILGCDPRGPDNVFLALGAYRNGILLAPAIADAVAGLILGHAPDPALRPFAPNRFEGS